MFEAPDFQIAIGAYLPDRRNPIVPGPWLTPNLVPQPLWGRNLRTLLTPSEWDRIRTKAYEACGRRCTICGSAGKKWPVEADEVWRYDDATNTQTLADIVGLCPRCHEVRHWGKATTLGHRDRALSHLAGVNRWSLIQASEEVKRALALWHQRSSRTWKSDYSEASSIFGFHINEDGYSRAEEANRRLIAQARARLKGTARAAR